MYGFEKSRIDWQIHMIKWCCCNECNTDDEGIVEWGIDVGNTENVLALFYSGAVVDTVLLLGSNLSWGLLGLMRYNEYSDAVSDRALCDDVQNNNIVRCGRLRDGRKIAWHCNHMITTFNKHQFIWLSCLWLNEWKCIQWLTGDSRWKSDKLCGDYSFSMQILLRNGNMILTDW